MSKLFTVVSVVALISLGAHAGLADDFGTRFDDQRPDALADIDGPPQGIYSLEDILNLEPAAGGDEAEAAAERTKTEFLGGGRVRVRDEFRLQRARGLVTR